MKKTTAKELRNRLSNFIDGIEKPTCPEPQNIICFDYDDAVLLLKYLTKA